MYFHFSKKKKLDHKFGDITYTFPSPTVVKSRPIIHSKNSIILGLNKVRHFNFVKDPIEFMKKKIWLFGGAMQKIQKKRIFYKKLS